MTLNAANSRLAIGEQTKCSALLVGRRPAHLVRETPMGLDAQRQPERRALAIEQAVSRVERDGLQGSSAAIIEPAHAGDVVIRDRRIDGEPEPFREAVFGLERRRDVIIGAAELAKTAGRISLELLFARCPDVAAFREAEHVFGIDFAGLVIALARSPCAEPA